MRFGNYFIDAPYPITGLAVVQLSFGFRKCGGGRRQTADEADLCRSPGTGKWAFQFCLLRPTEQRQQAPVQREPALYCLVQMPV